MEDVTNKYVHFDLGLYNDQTNEFEYYDIQDLKILPSYYRRNEHRGVLYSRRDSEHPIGNIALGSYESTYSIHLIIDDIFLNTYYVSEDTIEYNDPIPLGTFRSNDFKEDSRYPNHHYSYCIVEIKEITEEEYKNANGKNVIVDLFDRKGVRKYCSIVFYFYDFKQEEWIECETKYGYYYISNGTYFGILYKKGTNEIIENFELKCKKEKEYDFSISIGTDAYFTKIEDKVL